MDLSGPVDWNVVDDELALVPAQFKDPRFDSLRHVLNILGPKSIDSDLRLDEVRVLQSPCLMTALFSFAAFATGKYKACQVLPAIYWWIVRQVKWLACPHSQPRLCVCSCESSMHASRSLLMMLCKGIMVASTKQLPTIPGFCSSSPLRKIRYAGIGHSNREVLKLSWVEMVSIQVVQPWMHLNLCDVRSMPLLRPHVKAAACHCFCTCTDHHIHCLIKRPHNCHAGKRPPEFTG